ncbi:MAG: hypothetical protein ACRC06_15770 [Waterburya sp.]
MSKKKPNLPKRLIQGKAGRAEAKVPSAAGAEGSIGTNWKDINWTPKKLSLAIAFLSIPYLIAVIGTFRSGNILIAMVLVGLGLFVGLLYLALRMIEKGDF